MRICKSPAKSESMLTVAYTESVPAGSKPIAAYLQVAYSYTHKCVPMRT